MADDDSKSRPANPFGFKCIADYSDDELKLAVEYAVEHCKLFDVDFYTLLRGIDAYMEKRRRKQAEAPSGGRHGHRADVGSQ